MNAKARNDMDIDKSEKIKEDFYHLHKIMAHFGWSDIILTHLSARVNAEYFLISPFSLLFEDITVEDLVLADRNGSMGNTQYPINPAGFIIHQAIYENRPEINCIIHTHTDDGVAVSCLDGELLIADQMSFMFNEKIGYHDFSGVELDKAGKESLLKDLGQNNCLILRNHGLLVVGSCIAEAFWHYYYLEKLCRIYIRLLPVLDKIKLVPEDIKNKTYAQHKEFSKFSGLVSGIPGNPELAFSALKKKFSIAEESKIVRACVS